MALPGFVVLLAILRGGNELNENTEFDLVCGISQ
jgi:hypothetical protein